VSFVEQRSFSDVIQKDECHGTNVLGENAMGRQVGLLLFALGILQYTFAEVPDLEDMPQRFYSYFNKGDAAGLASLYAEDATFYSDAAPQLIVGRQDIRKYFDNLFNGATSYRLEPLESHWQKHENFAVRTATANEYMELKDGKKIGIPLRATYVYQKESKGWLITHHQATQQPTMSDSK
jgi:uncharacterized protein (TIGR02246 family)